MDVKNIFKRKIIKLISPNNIMNKTVKIIWVLSGIFVFLWTIFWVVRVLDEPGIVGNVIKYTLGIYLCILYILVAIIYWVNRKLYKRKIKKLRRKWQIKK